MSHIDGVMRYDLKKSVKYSENGDFVEADYVELYEFNSAHVRFYTKLKTYVDKAIMDAQKLNKDREQVSEFAGSSGQKGLHEVSEEDHKIGADDMAELLEVAFSLSEDDDRLFNFLTAFRSMVVHTKVHPIAKLDGKQIVNDVLWDNIHPDDQLQLAYKYCAFFGIGLLGRLMDGSETASERPTAAKAL